MNIIWIDGGLGNQMFQYALAMKLESLGKKVKIDVTKYEDHYVHNGFELERIFNIECSHASNSEIKQLGYLKMNRWTELLRKTPFGKKTIYNNESYEFDDSVFLKENCYLEGYWQSEQYFSDIKEQVLKAYQFPKLDTEQLNSYAKEMTETCSVSVHIRRGDYLQYTYLQNICTMEYYKRAMQFFRERFPTDVMFYIFTNDFEWAEENFKSEDCRFVKGNTGVDSYRDMQLMSLCKHNIVANSSFSWWGAWLNQNPEKIVLAPERWINNTDDKSVDVVPESWIKIRG